MAMLSPPAKAMTPDSGTSRLASGTPKSAACSMPPEVKCRGGDEVSKEKRILPRRWSRASRKDRGATSPARRRRHPTYLQPSELSTRSRKANCAILASNQEVVLEAMVDKLASAFGLAEVER